MKNLTLKIDKCEECPYAKIQRSSYGHCLKTLKRIRFVFYKGTDDTDRNVDIPDWCPLEDNDE
jgi:hypothetical protein